MDKTFQLRNSLIFISGLSFLLAILVFSKWGPSLSTDTFYYFNLAKVVKNGLFPVSSSNSPGYPAILAFINSIFSTGWEEASWWISITIYLLAIFLWYYLILSALKDKSNKLKILFYSLFISNLWWSLKILLFAHADGVFYIFCLLIVVCVLHWGRNEKLSTWIFLCLLASVSVWIKYNGLIFLPFLAVCPLLFYGFNRKVWIGLVPIVSILPSFFIFKSLNGQVIRHLDSEREILKVSNEISWETFSANIEDTGKAIFDFFFTSYLTSRIPIFLTVLFFIAVIALYFFLLFKWFGKEKIELVLLSFGIVYILGMGFIFQLTNHTEMNSRTLFPVFIFSVAFIGYMVVNTKRVNSYGIGLLFFLCLINFTRSTHGLVDWYNRAPMDSFVLVNQFKTKSSVVKSRELVELLNIDHSKIYTNQVRNLSAAFDYEIVRNFGMEYEFQRGKVRLVESSLIEDRVREMHTNLINEDGIIVLFDFKSPDKISSYDSIQFHHLRIEDDLIIYKKN
jgi:hypothetical protein